MKMIEALYKYKNSNNTEPTAVGPLTKSPIDLVAAGVLVLCYTRKVYAIPGCFVQAGYRYISVCSGLGLSSVGVNIDYGNTAHERVKYIHSHAVSSLAKSPYQAVLFGD